MADVKQQNIKTLQEFAEEVGIEAEELDEFVHDTASRMASAVNNGGVNEQIEFLYTNWGMIPTGDALQRLANLKKASDPGVTDGDG